MFQAGGNIFPYNYGLGRVTFVDRIRAIVKTAHAYLLCQL
jgi:hypothetical protein